jgi:hypothetical protein
MLTGMDIPVAAGPWLVLGVVLGVLLPALAALGVLALRRTRPERDAREPLPPAGFDEDDLPGFLESPAGCVRTPAASGGWVALTAPAAPPPASPARRDFSPTTAALAAMAGTALLLVGAAAAVATARTTESAGPAAGARGSEPATAAPRPAEVSARLSFGGVVLERHAVGVTVAYPRVQVTARGGRAVAEVELVTYNCLRTDAPESPATAGCTPSVPEHAELTTPGLTVRSDGAGLRVSGRFATSSRSHGTAPAPTGRVYELTVRAAPADGRAGEGREPATGVLELGDDRVGTTADGPNDITYAG